MDLAGLKTYLDGLGPTFTLASSDATSCRCCRTCWRRCRESAIALTARRVQSPLPAAC